MKDALNLPNILTYIRIALVPVFVTLFYAVNIYVALAIFVVACVTDVIDGFVARKFNMITNLGKDLDPFADKLLKLSTLICFVSVNIIPLWFLIVMLSLDLFLVVSGVIILKQGIIIKSNLFGKLGTLFISLGVLLCFFYEYLNNWNLYILYFGLFIVFVACISYTVTFFIEKKKQKNIEE